MADEINPVPTQGTPTEERLLRWGARLAIGGAVVGAIIMVVYVAAIIVVSVSH